MKTDSEIILEAYYDSSNINELKTRLDDLWYNNMHEEMWILFCKFCQNNYGVDLREEIKKMKSIQQEHVYKTKHLTHMLKLERNACIQDIVEKTKGKVPEDVLKYLLETDPK